MKNKLRLAFVIFLILALLLAASPASAGAVKTPVSGIATFMSEPDNPDYRGWFTGAGAASIGHFRDAFQVFEFKVDDPRLDGWQWLVLDGEWTFKPDGSLDIHVWGQSTLFADSEFTVPTWKCSSTGTFAYTPYWEYLGGIVYAVCSGLGDNEGLLAKLTVSQAANVYSDDYVLSGYILEPGG